MAKMKAERTCINCGKKAGKRELFRIVRTPEGEVAFDCSGNAAGRGAYVCSEKCLAGAIESGRLSRALRTKITDEAPLIAREISHEDEVEVV